MLPPLLYHRLVFTTAAAQLIPSSRHHSGRHGGRGTQLELAQQLQRPNNAKLHWRPALIELENPAFGSVNPRFCGFFVTIIDLNRGSPKTAGMPTTGTSRQAGSGHRGLSVAQKSLAKRLTMVSTQR
jgi:hypothetical protein